jgi:hypothetical protein
MFVEGGPAIHDDNKVEDGRDNTSIAELNEADEHSIEFHTKYVRTVMATILKFQPMMIKIEKIAMTMVEIVMTTAIAVEIEWRRSR